MNTETVTQESATLNIYLKNTVSPPALVMRGKVEHINYFAIKEGGIAAPFGKEGSNLIGSTFVENDAVEYRIDDIAGSSGCEHGNSQYIS